MLIIGRTHGSGTQASILSATTVLRRLHWRPEMGSPTKATPPGQQQVCRDPQAEHIVIVNVYQLRLKACLHDEAGSMT